MEASNYSLESKKHWFTEQKCLKWWLWLSTTTSRDFVSQGQWKDGPRDLPSKRQRTITIANGLLVAYGINRLDSHFRSVSEIPEWHLSCIRSIRDPSDVKEAQSNFWQITIRCYSQPSNKSAIPEWLLSCIRSIRDPSDVKEAQIIFWQITIRCYFGRWVISELFFDKAIRTIHTTAGSHQRLFGHKGYIGSKHKHGWSTGMLFLQSHPGK